MRERDLIEEKIYSQNEIKIIDLYHEKLLLEPKLNDAEKAFGKSCKAIKDYFGWWFVTQVPLIAGTVICFDQMPWYTQIAWVVAGCVSEGMMVYDMQKYFRTRRAFLKVKEKYSSLNNNLKECKTKLTTKELKYLIYEEGVNLID